MCDFDDFFDEGFEEDFGEDFDSDLGTDADGDSGNDCEGWCFGDDLADFAILGGAIGYLEEEIQERKRLEREMEKAQERIEKTRDCDCPVPSDEDPYP